MRRRLGNLIKLGDLDWSSYRGICFTHSGEYTD